ncbi:MAG TPA: hypothetical protein VN201_01725 [Roseateles sp.]|nr:hypothetical protein [Roseateles sp.]HWT53890.1 hypothetical protein [Rhodocyclaceae bacterium]
MKFTSILAAALIAVSSSAVAPLALAHADHGKPQYGGIYGEAGTFQLELVAAEHTLTFYATLHGEPIATKGASGKVTILGADGSSSEAQLVAAGDNQLVAKIKQKPAPGSKILAAVSMPGKPAANIRYAIE